MVFYGKPSGGCHACRERKTKCDQILEGCTQCKRAKRNCPGYRALGDLIFRDESTNVARKAKVSEARKQAALKSLTSISNASVEEESTLQISIAIVQHQDPYLSSFRLSLTVEDLATGYFVTNYVIGPAGSNKGHLDLIGDLSRAGNLDGGLLSSMKAVGLAGLSHAANKPDLLKNARYQYVRALQSTNAALRDPVRVKEDSTLLSILVLGIFESVTGCRQNSLSDWQEHISGAASVIKLRGPDQIKSPSGRRMLIQVTANLLISCLSRGIQLPKHIIEYMTAAIKFVETPDPAFIVQDIMLQYSTLYAEVASRRLTVLETILARALELDSYLLKITTDIPQGWEYKIVSSDEPSDFAFNRCYHVYTDSWIAQIWNSLRTSRILINEMIRGALLAGFCSKPPVFTSSEHTAQFQISTDTIYQMQADILYTVPQQLGYFPPGKVISGFNQTGTSRFSGDLHELENLPHARLHGGLFLLWPLWLAGILDLATEEVRGFVIRNLNSIGNRMGLKQAHAVADNIAAKVGPTVWNEN